VRRSLLRKYTEVWRYVFLNIVNPMSQANTQRVCQSNQEDVGETDPFLKMLQELDADGKQALQNLAELQVGVGQFGRKRD
jgi:hypothetical protein